MRRFLVTITCSSLVGACGPSYVETMRQASIAECTDVPLGMIEDSFFRNSRWSKDDSGMHDDDIVLLTGNIKIINADDPVLADLLFYRNRNTGKVRYIGLQLDRASQPDDIALATISGFCEGAREDMHSGAH